VFARSGYCTKTPDAEGFLYSVIIDDGIRNSGRE
jgi:hypothetical protein